MYIKNSDTTPHEKIWNLHGLFLNFLTRWTPLLCIFPSNGLTLFFFVSEDYSMVYTYHTFFIHPFIC